MQATQEIQSTRFIGINFYMPIEGIWVSHHDWFYAEALRNAAKVKELGLECKVVRREWGPRGYWHIEIDDTILAPRRKELEQAEHDKWLAEQEAFNEHRRKLGVWPYSGDAPQFDLD